MSTTIQLRVKSSNIQVTNIEMLNDALKLAAAWIGGEVESEVKDHRGYSRSNRDGMKILGSLSSPIFKPGVGVALNSKNILQFVGDSDYDKNGFEKVVAEITKAYNTLLVIQAAKENGCEVGMEVTGGYIKLEVAR